MISDDTKKQIGCMINKQYKDDVELALCCRSCCKNTADVMETLCHVIVGLSAIVAFAAGLWDMKILTYVAGIMNIVSIVLSKFAGYNTSESKQYTIEINKITTQIGVGQIVDISDDPSGIAVVNTVSQVNNVANVTI